MDAHDDTVDGMFRQAVRRFPDRTFIQFLDDQREWSTTYAEATTRVAHAVERLLALGLRPGDRAVTYGDAIVPLDLLEPGHRAREHHPHAARSVVLDRLFDEHRGVDRLSTDVTPGSPSRASLPTSYQ